MKTLVNLKKELREVEGNPGSSWQEIALVQRKILAATAGIMQAAQNLIEQQIVDLETLENQVEFLEELCLERGWKYESDTKGQKKKAD